MLTVICSELHLKNNKNHKRKS